MTLQSGVVLGWSTDLPLKHALLVYRGDKLTAVTLHDIVQDADGKQPRLGPGRLPAADDLRTLCHEILQSDHGKSEWLPDNILMLERSRIAWWEPARRRPMFFETQDTALNALSGRSFPQPALLFIATGFQLAVVALPKNRRPRPQDPIARAPYYNVYDDHHMCPGSVPLPGTHDVASIPAWSKAFFHSSFSHASGTTRRSRFAGSHAELWLAAAKARRFDPAWLAPCGKLAELKL
jgi:PRTRC genetic system protein B